MIKVNRLSKPNVLKSKGAKWTNAIRQAKTKSARKNAIEKYKHKEIRSTLEAMFNGKCAYCESRIGHVSYGHIEHYKPKLKYPLLAVEWNNLLLSCSVCNGTENKGEKFPTSRHGGPIINPVIENPGYHLKFYYDKAAQVASVLPKTKRGRVTITLLGLNRKKLIRHRSKFVKKLEVLAKLGLNDQEAYDLIEEAKGRTEEYSAFAKAVFRMYF